MICSLNWLNLNRDKCSWVLGGGNNERTEWLRVINTGIVFKYNSKRKLLRKIN